MLITSAASHKINYSDSVHTMGLIVLNIVFVLFYCRISQSGITRNFHLLSNFNAMVNTHHKLHSQNMISSGSLLCLPDSRHMVGLHKETFFKRSCNLLWNKKNQLRRRRSLQRIFCLQYEDPCLVGNFYSFPQRSLFHWRMWNSCSPTAPTSIKTYTAGQFCLLLVDCADPVSIRVIPVAF